MLKRSKPTRTLWTALAVLIFVGAGVVVYAALSQRADALPKLSNVPDFTLTSQRSESVSLADLNGHVWVADLIFTTCSGPCLVMTSQMSRVQEATKDEPGLRLVSVSVDPTRDTPERLDWYAKLALADERWIFLTGDMAKVRSLAIDGFKLGLENSGDPNAILHSDKFVLVDRDGAIRGYYDGKDESDVNRLIADARRLISSS
jgi:protein SCO1/2